MEERRLDDFDFDTDFLERNIPYLLYILRIAFLLTVIAIAF